MVVVVLIGVVVGGCDGWIPPAPAPASFMSRVVVVSPRRSKTFTSTIAALSRQLPRHEYHSPRKNKADVNQRASSSSALSLMPSSSSSFTNHAQQGLFQPTTTTRAPTTTLPPLLRQLCLINSRPLVPSSSSYYSSSASSLLWLCSTRRSNGGDNPDHNNNKSSAAATVYVATCIPGLASILADELHTLGAQNVETMGNAACRFRVPNLESILYILVWIRTPHKVMELLCESSPTLETRQDIYDFCRSTIPVKQLLGNGRGGLLTFSITSTVFNNPSYIPQDINHSHYTALNIKHGKLAHVFFVFSTFFCFAELTQDFVPAFGV